MTDTTTAADRDVEAASVAGSPEASEAPRREDPSDRIWELELLISGAVTLGLLQLPGGVDAFYRSLDARVSTESATALLLGYEFTKIILYLLIASFVLHLGARAYWVALIGLYAIFPGGIRWGELPLRAEPRRFYRRNTPALPAAIEGCSAGSLSAVCQNRSMKNTVTRSFG